MTLSDREKFIQHYITITTLRTLVTKINSGDLSLKALKNMGMEGNKSQNKHDVEVIWKTRCRKLTQEGIHELFSELSEEALLGGSAVNERLS
tara:strand:+ start:46 stop:321 length:276 start_codon:yes stop_codon:yes gene_type:complete